MRKYRKWISIALGIMFSCVVIGCGEAEQPVNDDPNAPAVDEVPEEDFEGEAENDGS